MSQNNSFMLLSQTKGPLIKLDNNYAQLTSETASQQQTLVASKAFFKSTPSLAPSIQSSINSYKNKNENYIDYEFEPIRQKPKSNPNLSSACRELFTPDSLESTLSSCSLTDSDDDNNIINRDKESLNLEDDEDYEHINSKTDSGLSISPQLTHSSTSEDKHFDLDIDFEIDEEICQLTERNESSIILEKIEKINRLQEKINDINLKIKSIDMNSNCTLGLDNSSSTSDEQMTNFEHKQQERLMDENFRNRNNQTRMGIRGQSDNFFDDNNEKMIIDDYSDDEKEQDEQEEDNDDDNDDDDDDYHDYYTVVRQAQPIKKYASTGYLFNRFGSYLAPIEEAPEELVKSSSNSSIVSTDSSDYLTQPTFYTKKTSTSCFNLELIKLKSETCNHTKQEINNNRTNALLLQDACSPNLANLNDQNNSFDKDVDLFWSNLPDSSLLIEREEFVDSSSLIESINFSKEEEECKEESELLDDDNNDNKSAPKVPEDNVERLRNIRDMFENRQEDDLIELKKVEKLQPSEKLKQAFLNDKHNINNHQTQQLIVTMDVDDDKHKSINGDSMCMYESQQTDVASLSASSSSVSSIPSPNNDDSLNQDNKTRFEEGVVNENDEELEESTKIGNKDIMPFADLNNVKTKFENITLETEESNEPKPVRSITPPREGADRVEIENEPMVRAADVVSVYERIEDSLPDAGYIKSRREMFSSVSSPSIGDEAPRNKKSITPPRDDILKRVLKEKTPDRLDNVIRESDRSEDVLPSVGSIKQTAAIFNSGGARQRSIERSGITIEGELTEKGIAKSRLALFSDPSALVSPPTSNATDQELDLIKNASGIAKERLSLFKNLEQSNGQRSSPDRTIKKLKEFTPPPQMEPRQYIIIDKEDQSPTSVVDVSAYNKDEFVPESGLAKNRMKQYLDQASNSAETNETSLNETSELQGKGLAKSLLAKWKSIENIKDVSPESKRHASPTQDEVPMAGTAKNLLNKWQNIDTTSSNKENCERKGLKAFTPPPADQLNQLDQDNDASDNDDDKSKQQAYEDELALLKGAAKNTLKKFEQSLAESNNRVKRTVTPPKEFISQIGQASVKTVFESQPVESNINAHYAEEEIIPPQGYAKNLKQKFLNLEKEAAKIETSSSKMNYVPKKFTSSTSPAYQSKESSKSVKQQSPPSKQVGKLNGNGLLTTVSNGQNTNGQNNEKCSTCDKTVYAMEKIEADKKVYHKACFKCTSCSCPLNLPSVEFHQNKPYCLNECKSNATAAKDLGVIVVDTSYEADSSLKSSKVISPNMKNVSPSVKSPKSLSSAPKSPATLNTKSPSGSKSPTTPKKQSPNPSLSPKPK